MPTVLRVGPYRFSFFSIDANEPEHIHVRRGRSKAKYWLGSTVMLAGVVALMRTS